MLIGDRLIVIANSYFLTISYWIEKVGLSLIGPTIFEKCKSSTNCYITTDDNFFGPDQLDKFDAVIFKPGHLRADKVLFFDLC